MMNPRTQRKFSLAQVMAVASIFLLPLQSSFAQQNTKELHLTLTNPLNMERVDEMVVIAPAQLSSKFSLKEASGFLVFQRDQEIPSQWIVAEGSEGLGFVLPKIGAKETIEVRIILAPKGHLSEYTKRTQAELSHKFGGEFKGREYLGGHFENVQSLHVPAEHTDHSWFIRYEGPGWESDLVAYRFYLDWRNGIDVFGKKVHEMVLQNVGKDGFDSYHEPAEWGMDVLKVGKTLGLGSIATWENNVARRVDVTDSLYAEIPDNGPVYSSVLTKYYGWNLPSGKTDIRSLISIHAGTRLSKVALTASSPLPNFATGLIKDPKGELIKGDGGHAFNYIATYGAQSLNNDKLGIAVIYPVVQLKEVTEDELSHVLVFNSEGKSLSYYILAAWELEPNGIQDETEFKSYLDEQVLKLSSPLEIKIQN